MVAGAHLPHSTVGTLTAIAASGQLAIALKWLMGGPRPPACQGPATLLALLAGALAFAFCERVPDLGLPWVVTIAHAMIYGGLLSLFARSLLPGRDPLVTRLARRIHAPVTPRRAAYTRAVTWVWAVYFTAQFAASLVWLVAPAGLKMPVFVGWVDLPAAALLFTCEFALRTWWFRHEPHGSAIHMIRLLKAQAAPGSGRAGSG